MATQQVPATAEVQQPSLNITLRMAETLAAQTPLPVVAANIPNAGTAPQESQPAQKAHRKLPEALKPNDNRAEEEAEQLEDIVRELENIRSSYNDIQIGMTTIIRGQQLAERGQRLAERTVDAAQAEFNMLRNEFEAQVEALAQVVVQMQTVRDKHFVAPVSTYQAIWTVMASWLRSAMGSGARWVCGPGIPVLTALFLVGIMLALKQQELQSMAFTVSSPVTR